METKYSVVKGLTKAVTSFVLFAIPFALQVTPDQYLNLTVGGLLVLVLNAVKVWAKNNLNV